MNDYIAIKEILSKPSQSEKEARDKEELERSITLVRANRLKKAPIIGNYDLEHLSKTHRYLFDGLYDHAGQLRPPTENWGKQNAHDLSLYSEFLPISDAIKTIEETSNFLRENNLLKDLDKDDFIYEFAVSYAEFNSAHPFVEGNGRAMRIMFQQLANESGYRFNIKNVDKVEWDIACTLSGTHFILYDDGKGGFVGKEQEINIEPLLNLVEQCLEKDLSLNLSSSFLEQNYPSISKEDREKIQLYKDYLEREYAPDIANIALENLHKNMPDIASGKIILPPLPNEPEKDKGKDR